MRDKAHWRLPVLKTFLALAFLLGNAAYIWGETGSTPVTLFVRKTTVPAVMQGGHVHAPLTDLLRSMGYEWAAKGDAFEVRKGTAGGPDVKSRHVTLLYEGRSFAPDTTFHNGRVWVSVKPLAEALGALYIETPGTGIAQVGFPQGQVTQKDVARAVKEAQRRPSVEAKPLEEYTPEKPAEKTGDKKDEKVAEKPAGKPAEGDAKEEDKEPIEAKVEFTNPAIPGAKNPAEVRGTCTVKNTSDQTVRNVKIDITFVDPSGGTVKHLDEHPKKFDEMTPGSTVQWDFMWYNYYNYMDLKPKVDVAHDPLPKKKKEEKKDEKSGDKSDEKSGDKKDAGETPAPKK